MTGHKKWLAEVQFLGVLEHPNLVKLFGYCVVDRERGAQRLFVYEYMPNKSLEDHLFSRIYTPLSWNRRLQIILGAAGGLSSDNPGLELQISEKASETCFSGCCSSMCKKRKQIAGDNLCKLSRNKKKLPYKAQHMLKYTRMRQKDIFSEPLVHGMCTHLRNTYKVEFPWIHHPEEVGLDLNELPKEEGLDLDTIREEAGLNLIELPQ